MRTTLLAVKTLSPCNLDYSPTYSSKLIKKVKSKTPSLEGRLKFKLFAFGNLIAAGRDAGNRTQSTRTRSVRTTGILHPDFN